MRRFMSERVCFYELLLVLTYIRVLGIIATNASR